MNARRRFVPALLGALGLGLGCMPPTGGWDTGALLSRHPEVRAIRLQRIGDLTPYPALVDGRISLVTCRFPDARRPIPIEVTGDDWPSTWGEAAIEAVDAALPAIAFERIEGPLPGPGIVIRSLSAAGGPGPIGLGDARAECDVGESGDPETDVRGHVQRAEIRIRRRVVGNWAQEQAATAEGWVGAMLHELGHALGFQGHAAVGDSLVQLEESRLRALGRRALEGTSIPTPNLRALYRIPPGTRLGEATLSEAARATVAAIVEEIAARRATSGPPVAALSLVGDRHARLVWRWSDGPPLVLRFPNWTASLRWGRPVEARRGELAGRPIERAP